VSRIKLIAAILSVLAASPSMAQEHQHGTGEKLGAVHFATSCNGVAQKDMNRAVALLHSFQFSRAIEGFNGVLGEDATCAIAYWGIALSDWSNPFAPGIKDKGQLQLGRDSVERGTAVGAKVVDQRPEDAEKVDASVGREGLVLDRNDRFPQDGREVVVIDHHAPFKGKRADHPALLVIEVGCRGRAVALQIMNLRQVDRVNQREAGQGAGDDSQGDQNEQRSFAGELEVRAGGILRKPVAAA